MEVPQDTLFVLLSCSVRYALGRRSYVVSEVADLCLKYAAELSEAQRGVIVKDIREALKAAESYGVHVGMAMDHEVWQNCLASLEALNDGILG